MTHFEDLARQRREALAGVPPAAPPVQMGSFEDLARKRQQELTGVPDVQADEARIRTGEAQAVANQANIGIAESLGLPVDIVTSVINAAAAAPQILAGREPSRIEPAIQRPALGSQQLTESFEQFQEPETTGGRLAGRAARFAAGSIAPASAIPGVARTIAAAPGRAIAAEGIASASAALGGEATAQVAGEGARPFGELAGGLAPIGVTGGVQRAAGREQRRLAGPRRVRGEEELIARGSEAALGAEEFLLPAQRVGEPFLLEAQSFLAQLPSVGRKAANALKTQNRKAFDIAESVVNEIADPETLTTAGARFQTAAKKAVELKKVARANKASPLFNNAFNAAKAEKLRVNIKPVLDDFKILGEQFSSKTGVGKVLSRVEGSIRDSAGRGLVRKPQPLTGVAKILAPRVARDVVRKPPIGDNLKALHGAKTDLDRDIAKAVKEGDNQLLSVLMGVKEKLVTAMTDASPIYRQAEEAFAELSPQVNKIVQSVIGRAAALDPQSDKVARLADQVFSGATQNPSSINNTKKIIRGIDPAAWKAITRAEIEKRFGALSQEIAETGTLAIENVPKQLQRAIFGSTKQRANLLAAMDGKTKENFLFLESVLKRASLGRPGGSQTGVRAEISDRLRSMANKFRVLASPLQAVSERGTRAIDERIVEQQARIFFDPQGFDSALAGFKGSPTDPRVISRTLAALDEAISNELP